MGLRTGDLTPGKGEHDIPRVWKLRMTRPRPPNFTGALFFWPRACSRFSGVIILESRDEELKWEHSFYRRTLSLNLSTQGRRTSNNCLLSRNREFAAGIGTLERIQAQSRVGVCEISAIRPSICLHYITSHQYQSVPALP